jgi:hypothetical protein
VRLCLAKKDYIRAQILARKISPRAFQKQQGDSTGEIGIEGTAIEEADAVSALQDGTAGLCCYAAEKEWFVTHLLLSTLLTPNDCFAYLKTDYSSVRLQEMRNAPSCLCCLGMASGAPLAVVN